MSHLWLFSSSNINNLGMSVRLLVQSVLILVVIVMLRVSLSLSATYL